MSLDRVRIDGNQWRVQITVFDIAPSLNYKGSLNFSVQKLPIMAPKFTAFSCGEQIYYGSSLEQAIAVAADCSEWVPLAVRAALPKSWKRYER